MRFDVEAEQLTFAKNGTDLEGQIQNVAYTEEQLAIFKVRTRQGAIALTIGPDMHAAQLTTDCVIVTGGTP